MDIIVTAIIFSLGLGALVVSVHWLRWSFLRWRNPALPKFWDQVKKEYANAWWRWW